MSAPRTAFTLTFAATLLLSGCDLLSDGGGNNTDFAATVEVRDAGGAPVEGLRVGVVSCLPVRTEAAFDDACYAKSETTPPAAKTSSADLTSFEAEWEGENVLLTWRTASEQNNARFEVQRQTDDSDWRIVGTRYGAGTTDEAQRYALTDGSPPFTFGSLFYRLRQVKYDGSTSISDTVSLPGATPAGSDLHGRYPNPFSHTTVFAFELSAQSDVTLALHDLAGASVETLIDESKAPGRYETTWSAGDHPSGVYAAHFAAATQDSTARDTVYAVLRNPDAPFRTLGETNEDGTVRTTERGYFPGLIDLPAFTRRDATNTPGGIFRIGRGILVALTNPSTGKRQVYRRVVKPGAQTFELTWLPK